MKITPINRTTQKINDNQYRVYPKAGPIYYKNENGELNDIDLTPESSSTKIGDISLIRKNIVSIGKRLDNNPYKIIGMRPDNCQNGDKQIEFSLVGVEIDGEEKTIDIENDFDIDVSCSGIKQFIIANKDFHDYKIEFDIHLTGVSIENEHYDSKKNLYEFDYRITDYGEGPGQEIYKSIYTDHKTGALNKTMPFIDLHIGKINNGFIIGANEDDEFNISGVELQDFRDLYNYTVMYKEGSSMYMDGSIILLSEVYNINEAHTVPNVIARALNVTLTEDDGTGIYFIKNGKKIGGYYQIGHIAYIMINTKAIPQSVKNVYNKTFEDTSYIRKTKEEIIELITSEFNKVPKHEVDSAYFKPHKNGSFGIKINNESYYIDLPQLMDENKNVIDNNTNHSLKKIEDGLYRYTKFYSPEGVLNGSHAKYIDVQVNCSHNDLAVYKGIFQATTIQKTALNLTARRNVTTGSTYIYGSSDNVNVMCGENSVVAVVKGETKYTWYSYHTHYFFDTSEVTDDIATASFSFHGMWYHAPSTGYDQCSQSNSTTYTTKRIIALKSVASTTSSGDNYNRFDGHTSGWDSGDVTTYSDEYSVTGGNSNSNSVLLASRQDMPLNNFAKGDIKDDDDFKFAIIDKRQYYDDSINTCFGATASATDYAKAASHRNTTAGYRPYLKLTIDTGEAPSGNALFFGTNL